MDKQKLVSQIIISLEKKLANSIKAANIAHADAIGDESKAENKYDTRGLEASYLAGAQSRMAVELKMNLAIYQKLALKSFDNDSKIALTAFIELEAEDGSKRNYFLGPNSGGMELNYEGRTIFLVTIPSPMGRKLINREVGDTVEITSGNTKKDYEIVNIA